MAKGSRSASISASDDTDGASVGNVSLGGPCMLLFDAASPCFRLSAESADLDLLLANEDIFKLLILQCQ